MIKRNSQILHLWFLLCDLGLTVLAWLLAYFLRFEVEVIPVNKEPASFAQCCSNIPLLLLLSGIAYHLAGQYVIHRFRRVREEVVGAVKGTMLMGLFVMATTFGLQDPYNSRATMLLFLVLCPPLIILERLWSVPPANVHGGHPKRAPRRRQPGIADGPSIATPKGAADRASQCQKLSARLRNTEIS